MQKCIKCGVELTEKNWSINRRKTRNHKCNDCWYKYRRNWYHSNQNAREHQHNYCKNYREKQKKIVLAHYSGDPPRCACPNCYYHTHDCPIEFLTIDHINGGGREHRKFTGGFGVGFYLWLIHNGFPEGYQVLCYNCNCAKGHHGVCPHERQR